MVVLSAKLTFLIPGAYSLKDKRMVAKSIIEKAKNKFNASIAEVCEQDIHNKLVLGVAVAANSNFHANAMMDEIIRFIENNLAGAELIEIERD